MRRINTAVFVVRISPLSNPGNQTSILHLQGVHPQATLLFPALRLIPQSLVLKSHAPTYHPNNQASPRSTSHLHKLLQLLPLPLLMRSKTKHQKQPNPPHLLNPLPVPNKNMSPASPRRVPTFLQSAMGSRMHPPTWR
ncbi:hypothetical protein EMPG_14996 [Blastomyces silverae]|uniref:Uncharacterized protein n=1 Tax=Blastomyces silverae TaxID=2060906 RepID=A0A0H1BEJ7_9EURO|nr:hypothetical protein EMPG_14996 [Blastomyces silverae]